MSQQTPILADVLAFVEKAGRALHSSRQLATKVAADREKVASILPRDVDSLASLKMLDGKRLIGANEKQAAAEKLSSHAGALEVLNNVLDLFGEQLKQANATIVALRQGKGDATTVPTKTASAANSAGSPFVGRRHGTEDQPESFRKFASAMGVS